MPEPVLQHFARHGRFVPKEGGKLQVTLPGELIGSVVLKVHNRDIVIVELAVYYDRNGVRKTLAILGKSGHSYQPGQIVTCRRGVNDLGVEVWQPVDERQLHEMERAEQLAAEVSRQPTELDASSGTAADEIGSSPAAEPEAARAKKSLGPRRSKVARPAPPEPEPRRVLGPRRSKISHAQGAAP